MSHLRSDELIIRPTAPALLSENGTTIIRAIPGPDAVLRTFCHLRILNFLSAESDHLHFYNIIKDSHIYGTSGNRRFVRSESARS
jgi:hypothetical protein